MKKVLLIIASNGFQQIEYNKPKEILEKAGFEVVTASDKSGQVVAKDGSTTQVDFTLEEVVVDDYNGIFLIGGPGAIDHLDNNKTYVILQQAREKDKLYGAICISPRILAKAGVLENKKATGWDGDKKLEEILSQHNAFHSAEGVVVDGNLITASGPDAAEQFGQAISKLL